MPKAWMEQSPVLLLGSMLREEICTKSVVDFQAEGGNVIRDWKAQKLHWNPLPETGPCCRLEIFSNLSKGLLFLFLLHSSMLFLSVQNQYCTECTQQEAKQQQKNRLTITIFLLSTQTHLFQYSEQYRITWAIGITYWADLFKKMPEEQNVKTYTLLPGERWNSVVLGNMSVKTYIWSSLEKKIISFCKAFCSTSWFQECYYQMEFSPRRATFSWAVFKILLESNPKKMSTSCILIFLHERNSDLLNANFSLNLWVDYWGKLLLTNDDGSEFGFLKTNLLLK